MVANHGCTERLAHGKLRRLSLASTRQLYRDVQFLLEPPVLSCSLLTAIACPNLALSALPCRPVNLR
jgi:hypothetical protein